MGPSRDREVFTDETMPAIREAMTGDQRLERMAAAAVRRRREHRTDLTAYLAGAEFRMLGTELACFFAAGSWRTRQMDALLSLPAFSASVLQHRWNKLVTAGKRREALDVPGSQGVRLRAKQTRYAAEIFATLYRGRAEHRFIHRLSDLQQRLGVLDDGAVAMSLVAELGRAGGGMPTPRPRWPGLWRRGQEGFGHGS
jgi:CHAD domain-containing protein